MSAVVYRESYRLPAGILALAVHSAFFSLLYFGFTWQTQPAGTMSVELWQSLPDRVDVPPARPRTKEIAPPPEKVVEPEITPPHPEKIVEPEIVVPDEKAKAEKARAEKIAELAAREQAEQAARARAEQAAAIGRVVDEYTGKIAAKIRSNIVMPPDVANDARAEFLVTVLPGGSVLPPRLLKSSGNAAYDDAVERAILKSQPLPLPSDVAMFSKFREMKLGFRPKE